MREESPHFSGFLLSLFTVLPNVSNLLSLSLSFPFSLPKNSKLSEGGGGLWGERGKKKKKALRDVNSLEETRGSPRS